MTGFMLTAIAVFGIGLWIGVGAPGWPHKPQETRRHREHRAINPIAWGRTPNRERPRPKGRDERRIRLR